MRYILNIILFVEKYDEAVVCYEEVLAASRSVLGNTHPHTLVYVSNMGDVLKAQGTRNSSDMISFESKI